MFLGGALIASGENIIMKNVSIVVAALVAGGFIVVATAGSANAGAAPANGHDGGHVTPSNGHDGGHVTPANGHDGGHVTPSNGHDAGH